MAETQRLARRLACELDESDDYDNNDSEDYLHVSEDSDLLLLARETLEQQRNICEVLAPFAATYLAVAQSLQILHRSAMLESEFISFVINDISNKVTRGSCVYGKKHCYKI